MRVGPPAFYVLFLMIAAPIEMLLDWVQGSSMGSHPDLWIRPVSEGLLYIYAFIASTETLFRLSHNEKAVKENLHLRINKWIGLIVSACFVIFYVGNDRANIVDHIEISEPSKQLQVTLAMVSVLISYFTFRTTHHNPKSRPRTKKPKELQGSA